MQTVGSPFYRINDFFDAYAYATEQQDSKYMAACYALPCTIMSDEMSSVYNTAAKIEGLINQGKRFYIQHGISRAIPDVRNKRAVSPRIVMAIVNWRYLDKKGQKVYDCDYHYLLKLNEQGKWKIEVAIPINEKEQIEALIKKTAE